MIKKTLFTFFCLFPLKWSLAMCADNQISEGELIKHDCSIFQEDNQAQQKFIIADLAKEEWPSTFELPFQPIHLKVINIKQCSPDSPKYNRFITWISSIENLASLDLSNNLGLDKVFIRDILKSDETLKWLNLSGCDLSPSVLKVFQKSDGFAHLEFLNLSYNPSLTDKAANYIANSRTPLKLKFLSISNTFIRQNGIQALLNSSKLNNLIELRCDYNSLTSRLLDARNQYKLPMLKTIVAEKGPLSIDVDNFYLDVKTLNSSLQKLFGHPVIVEIHSSKKLPATHSNKLIAEKL